MSKDGRALRVAWLSARGVFAPAQVFQDLEDALDDDDFDERNRQAWPAGSIGLDLLFVEDARADSPDWFTDIAGDGKALEVSATYPQSMLNRAESMVASCDDDHPLTPCFEVSAPADRKLTLADRKLTVDALGRISDAGLSSIRVSRGGRRMFREAVQ